MSKADKAKELFESGCNCCQAVFCAFREETNLSEEEAFRLSAGFGGGLGRIREVCGAVRKVFIESVIIIRTRNETLTVRWVFFTSI